MSYEIVATLGPATPGPPIWRALADAGATAFRLNTSHTGLDELSRWLDSIEVFRSRGYPGFPLVLDLQGSKWRLGRFAASMLAEGDDVAFILAERSERPGTIPVPHEDFFRAAESAPGEVLMNDARVRARLLGSEGDLLNGRVTAGGEIAPGKGITLPGAQVRSERLLDKDLRIRSLTRDLPAVRYAVSYVRDAREMSRYRELLGTDAYLIAKLERREAMVEAAGIASSADELWVCRGDLGAELGMREMAVSVAEFSTARRNLPLPVLMAGQVLEHMSRSAQPTRSEVCHLHDLISAGYDGIVLSDETATGHFPAESCRAATLFRNR